MASKVTCSNCGWSWNKSDSSKKDMYVCHQCGRDNSNKSEGWLDKYDDGGTMQEYQENYNDYSVSAPEEMQGNGYSNVGRDYSPAWGGQFQGGGFLQPTSPKLPMGYDIPYNTPSTELSMSIGGGDGEPAYLIPSFKGGRKLKDPIAEYIKTGEHLGGPFKTLQEAEKFGEMRHKYVEKGQDIPSPIKTWGDMAMGGSLPGSVGFTYARTGNIPSNGKYAKKTLASAKKGCVVKDDMGYWNPDNHGKVVEIDSNDITMEGVDEPLLGISDEGDQQYMTPGNNYKFKGTKVREYPMAKNMAKNGKRQEQKGLINLDDLLNFTNYNIPKAQNGDFFGKGKMQTRSGETMTFDQASQILKKSLAPMVAEKAEYINSPLYKKRLVGMGEKDPNQVVKDRLQELKKIQFSSYDPRMNTKVKESLPSTTKKMFRSDKEGKTIGDYPSISLGVGWTPTSAAHELGHVTSSQTDRYVPTPTTGTGETMSPIEAKEFLNLSKAKPEFKKGAFALYDKNVRSNISNPYGAIYDTDLGSSYAKMKNIDEHSIGSGEAKGDLDAVRYLLKKQGITKKYGEDITPETLKKAQQNKNIQKDEFFQRLKKRFSDEDIIKLNNTIAQNNNSSQELTYAKLGTKLKTKGWLEKYN